MAHSFYLQNVGLLILSLVLSSPSCGQEYRIPSKKAANASQQDKPTEMSSQELQRANKAADRFIQRFQETLDFSVAYDEMFAADAVGVLRKLEFFKSLNLSPQLIKQLDDSTLKRTYKAEMNLYYLRFAYDLSQTSLDKSTPTLVTTEPLEIASMIKASKYRPLLSNGWSGKLPTLNTVAALKEYLAELNKVIELYRKYVSRDSFTSRKYQVGLERLKAHRRLVPGVKKGWPEIGISKNVSIYVVEKDLFVFPFIEEKGRLKILTLSMEP